MTSKPLVPSKDALRVLRCLAYSPPAAFVGAAGALCGVATVQYHERRKVRRAEKLLETKRKLHTITKGRGSTRLAHMFDAAERGEDFTINKSRRPGSSKRREYSALAAPQESDHATDWKSTTQPRGDDPTESNSEHSPLDHALSDVPASMKSASAQIEKQRVATVDPRMPYGNNESKQCEDPSFESLNDSTLPIRTIYKQSNVPIQIREPNKKHTWWDLRKIAGDDVSKLPGHILDILERTYQFQPFSGAINTYMEQQVTDLNPTNENHAGGTLSARRPVQVAENSKGNSILMKLDPSVAFAGNAFSALQPWQYSSDVGREVEDSEDTYHDQVEDERPPHVAALNESDLYLTSSAPVPSIQAKHQFTSRYNLRNPRVRNGMGVVGADRYRYVFTSLMNYNQENGKQASLSLLERIMNQYTVTDKRSDFALVQALFLDCTRLFETHELTPLVWRFVERFLTGDMPRLEVVSLLYPRCGAGTHSKEQHYYFLAHKYLEAIREKGYSLDRQVMELRKILAGTRMYNIELHEHLMIPVLRAFCSIGRMISAQALFDEMKSVHKVNTTTYSLQVLIRGYARIGNWTKVKSILDNYQSSESSQHKTYGLSSLLIAIVKDYSRKQSPGKVVKFIKHTIETYQIQPVSGLTREIVSLCLRHRRYDLIVSWIGMIQTQFPHIEIGISSSTFAYDISRVWKDINASIEDILNGCRALANQALRDPFSKVFRSTISEAVTRYLGAQLDELRREIGPEVPRYVTGEISSLHTSLKRLKDTAATQVHGSRARLLLAHVLKEGEALRWLDALCRGYTQSSGVTSRSINIWHLDQASEDSRNAKLSELTELRETLMKKYAREDKAGQGIEHDSLRELVNQLTEQGRTPHAFELIQSVYDSRWAQPPVGKEFDIELFTEWLQLAWALKSGSKLRSVLWAIVDASPQLQLSSQIILLARIAAPKTHLQRVKRARTYQVVELEYLQTRLKRRRWSATPVEKGLMLSEWRGFGASDAR